MHANLVVLEWWSFKQWGIHLHWNCKWFKTNAYCLHDSPQPNTCNRACYWWALVGYCVPACMLTSFTYVVAVGAASSLHGLPKDMCSTCVRHGLLNFSFCIRVLFSSVRACTRAHGCWVRSWPTWLRTLPHTALAWVTFMCCVHILWFAEGLIGFWWAPIVNKFVYNCFFRSSNSWGLWVWVDIPSLKYAILLLYYSYYYYYLYIYIYIYTYIAKASHAQLSAGPRRKRSRLSASGKSRGRVALMCIYIYIYIMLIILIMMIMLILTYTNNHINNCIYIYICIYTHMCVYIYIYIY